MIIDFGNFLTLQHNMYLLKYNDSWLTRVGLGGKGDVQYTIIVN